MDRVSYNSKLIQPVYKSEFNNPYLILYEHIEHVNIVDDNVKLR